MGHTHNFQSSGWGCQILPWSWDSKSRLIGISQGGRYKRGVSSENQVWRARNGAMRRRRAPLTFTLHSTAGISFIGGNAYRLTFGHGWANASMPRVVGNSGRTRAGTGMTLEKQRGPPPLCQTDPRSGIPSDGSTSIPPAWASVSTENRPPGSVLPEREPPSKRGTCLGTKGEDGAQACPGCATLNLLGGLCGTQPPYCPSWLWHDAPRERGENTSKPGRQPWVPGSLYAKRGTLPSTLHLPAFLGRPRPSLSLMRPSWSYGDGGSHPFSRRSGERRGLATLIGVDSNCATLWQGE